MYSIMHCMVYQTVQLLQTSTHTSRCSSSPRRLKVVEGGSPAMSDSTTMDRQKRAFCRLFHRLTKKGVPRKMRDPRALLTGLEALRCRR